MDNGQNESFILCVCHGPMGSDHRQLRFTIWKCDCLLYELSLSCKLNFQRRMPTKSADAVPCLLIKQAIIEQRRKMAASKLTKNSSKTKSEYSNELQFIVQLAIFLHSCIFLEWSSMGRSLMESWIQTLYYVHFRNAEIEQNNMINDDPLARSSHLNDSEMTIQDLYAILYNLYISVPLRLSP